MRTQNGQRRRDIAALAIAALWASAGSALAGPSGGCTAVNHGALDASVAPERTITREIALDAADTLKFSARAAEGARASVTLVGGSGAPQTLVGNALAAAVSFRAPQSGSYVFRFAADAKGPASIGVTCTSAEVAAASAAFLARRKDLLNAQDPDRIRIDRAPTPIANPNKPLSSSVTVDDEGNAKAVAFSVSLSDITAASDPSKKPGPGLVDLWLEGRMERYEASSADAGTSNGNLGILYLGTRSMLGPDVIIGALAQLDRGIETPKYGGAEMAATGWLVGPYLSMNLGSGVVFDGRAAWGETENAIPGPDLSDRQIDRRLVRAKLTGTRQVEGWTFAPSLALVYLEDAVRDGESGETKAAGTGKVELLPEVSRRFEAGGDTFIEPRAAIGGYLGFDEFSALSPIVTTEGAADLHLKAEAGVAVGVKDGSSVQATGGVESGGAATPESWTGRLQFNVPLGD